MTPVQNYAGFLYNLIYGCDDCQVVLEPQIALNSWSSKRANHQKMLGVVQILRRTHCGGWQRKSHTEGA